MALTVAKLLSNRDVVQKTSGWKNKQKVERAGSSLNNKILKVDVKSVELVSKTR
jgi:hypothetical protein